MQPRTGRVFVVTKSVFGGTVYVAPRRLRADHDNRLRTYARVAGLVTDGTFLPSGEEVLLRSYGTASAYTFPGFQQVGSVRLPSQPQGEGISVSATGRVLVGSEGVRSAVLQVRLPPALTAPPRTPVTQRPAPLPAAQPEDGPGTTRSRGDWWAIGGVAVLMVLGGVLTVRNSRVRGPRP